MYFWKRVSPGGAWRRWIRGGQCRVALGTRGLSGVKGVEGERDSGGVRGAQRWGASRPSPRRSGAGHPDLPSRLWVSSAG